MGYSHRHRGSRLSGRWYVLGILFGKGALRHAMRMRVVHGRKENGMEWDGMAGGGWVGDSEGSK